MKKFHHKLSIFFCLSFGLIICLSDCQYIYMYTIHIYYISLLSDFLLVPDFLFVCFLICQLLRSYMDSLSLISVRYYRAFLHFRKLQEFQQCRRKKSFQMKFSWYFYQMVSRITLCMCEEKQVFLWKLIIQQVTAVVLNKCLKQIELPIYLLACALISQLPSNISNMENFVATL